MGADITAYYIEDPDDKFFIMKGRREFAIENDIPISDEIREYFSDIEVCKSGILFPILMEYDYTDEDYMIATIKINDIPVTAETIVVRYG